MTKDWEVAGLTDEEGRLQAFLHGFSAILIPPDATIKKRKGKFGVIYPIPSKWGKVKPGEWYYRYRGSWIKDLISLGWKTKEDFKGVTEEFLRLSEASGEQVLNFARKWGPLWLCTKHVDCFMFGFFVHPWLVPNMGPCFWPGFETIEQFKKCAREVKAVLSIAAAFLEGKTTQPVHWEEIGLGKDILEDPIVYQQHLLTGTINDKLSRLGIGFSLFWDNAMPELSINKGIGFLPAVWLEVAQSVARARQICICDACQNVYIRYGRKPQKGRNNYCPTCREKYAKQTNYKRKNSRH